MRRANGAVVPGVLYRLDREALAALDRFEGRPFTYERVPGRVFASTKRWRTAETYVLRSDTPGRPATEYLDVIRRSYQVWGFGSLGGFQRGLKKGQSS